MRGLSSCRDVAEELAEMLTKVEAYPTLIRKKNQVIEVIYRFINQNIIFTIFNEIKTPCIKSVPDHSEDPIKELRSVLSLRLSLIPCLVPSVNPRNHHPYRLFF